MSPTVLLLPPKPSRQKAPLAVSRLLESTGSQRSDNPSHCAGPSRLPLKYAQETELPKCENPAGAGLHPRIK
jgi:hypothetical protein